MRATPTSAQSSLKLQSIFAPFLAKVLRHDLEPNKVWHMSWRMSWRKSVQCIFTQTATKLRKSTVAEVTTNYPKVFVQLPLQLKAHLNCKVSSHLFSPKSSGTILSQTKFGTCLGECHGGKVCNVFSHASLSLKLKALHSTKVHCKVKVATEKCFTPRRVVERKVVVTKSVVFRCARSA